MNEALAENVFVGLLFARVCVCVSVGVSLGTSWVVSFASLINESILDPRQGSDFQFNPSPISFGLVERNAAGSATTGNPGFVSTCDAIATSTFSLYLIISMVPGPALFG